MEAAQAPTANEVVDWEALLDEPLPKAEDLEREYFARQYRLLEKRRAKEAESRNNDGAVAAAAATSSSSSSSAQAQIASSSAAKTQEPAPSDASPMETDST